MQIKIIVAATHLIIWHLIHIHTPDATWPHSSAWWWQVIAPRHATCTCCNRTSRHLGRLGYLVEQEFGLHPCPFCPQKNLTNVADGSNCMPLASAYWMTPRYLRKPMPAEHTVAKVSMLAQALLGVDRQLRERVLVLLTVLFNIMVSDRYWLEH